MNKNTFLRLILILFFITGIFFLYMGYMEYFADIKKTKAYKTTDGYFMKYEMDNTQSPVIYKLTYSYVIDKQTYFIEAENKVTKLPALGSQKKIRYQEKNPQTAIVVDLSGGIKYIIVGLILLVIAIFGLINRLLNHYKENDRKFYKVVGMIGGIFILLIGVLIYYLYGISIDSSAILDIWNAVGYMSIIPFILVLVGMVIVITIVFFQREEPKK